MINETCLSPVFWQDAVYVQECVPENLDLKRKVWTEIGGFATRDDAILASSTSCIVPSKISEQINRREQFIVAHPVLSQRFWLFNSYFRRAGRLGGELIGEQPSSVARPALSQF